MLVHALVAAVRTRPEPAVLAVLDGFDEELAYFVRRRFRVAVFAQDDLGEFGCSIWVNLELALDSAHTKIHSIKKMIDWRWRVSRILSRKKKGGSNVNSSPSSQSAMSSFRFASSSPSLSLVSLYKSRFSPFLSTARSWLNLHFRPFSQLPCLKKMHSTVLGSTPNGTFCTCTGLKSSAASRLACSEAAFSLSRCAFSASLRFCSGVLASAAWDFMRAICFCDWAPFFYRG